MAAQKGSSFLVKMTGVGSPDADYDTIGGFRTKTLRLNSRIVDITDQDSADWQEILSGAGILSMEISGSGVFKDSVTEAALLTKAMAKTHASLKITVPGLGDFTGTFAIPQLTYTGPHEEAVAFDVTFQSSGVVAFA